jgi:predicted restriction endonuclease
MCEIGLSTQLKIKRYKSGLNPYSNREYYERYPRIVITEKFRELIYKRFKNKCVVCGESLSNSEQVDLHHLKPKAKGEKYTIKNIVPVHQTCHVGITHARKQLFNLSKLNNM